MERRTFATAVCTEEPRAKQPQHQHSEQHTWIRFCSTPDQGEKLRSLEPLRILPNKLVRSAYKTQTLWHIDPKIVTVLGTKRIKIRGWGDRTEVTPMRRAAAWRARTHPVPLPPAGVSSAGVAVAVAVIE